MSIARKRVDTAVLRGLNINFEDDVWRLPNDNPAAHDRLTVLDWRIPIGKGLLTDRKHATLLNDLKTFFLAALSPDDKKAWAPTTAVKYWFCLKPFVQWITSYDIASLGDVGDEHLWAYAEYLFEYLEEEGDEERLTFQTIYDRLRPISAMHEYKESIEAIGGNALGEPAFGGRATADVVTRDFGLTRKGRLLPIPDDVAIPVLTQAMRLIGRPADDVVRLQQLHVDICTREAIATARAPAYAEYNEAIRSFRFSCVPGESVPWHGQIADVTSRVVSGREFEIRPTQRVRRLVVAITTACLTVIQGLTGMRASEILGLESKGTDETGLPSFIKKRRSEDGVLDLWYVEGRVVKGRKRPATWLIGSRTTGSSYEPPTLRAFRMLEALMAPWRALSGRKEAALTFKQSQGLPNEGSSVGRMTAMTMTVLMKEFLREWCDLSGAFGDPEEISRAIRGHRWRPTFALFVYRTDSRLLPAISDHFKHMSTAMVEDAYIGNNPGVIEAMDSSRVQYSAEMLLRMTTANVRIAGAGAQLVAKYGDSLREQISQREGDSMLEKAIAFCDENDIVIYRGAGGSCLVSVAPSRSACHRIAGLSSADIPVPSYAYRSTETCAGCRLHFVLEDDREFWEDRMVENQKVAYLNAGVDEGISTLAARRARQSEAILAGLDAADRWREC